GTLLRRMNRSVAERSVRHVPIILCSASQFVSSVAAASAVGPRQLGGGPWLFERLGQKMAQTLPRSTSGRRALSRHFARPFACAQASPRQDAGLGGRASVGHPRSATRRLAARAGPTG